MKIKWISLLMAYIVVTVGLFWVGNAWATLLAFHANMLLFLIIDRPNIPINVLVKGDHFPTLPVFVVVSMCSGLVLFLAWPYLQVAPDLAERLAALGLNSATWPGFIAYFTLVNPWIEEYFWRGYQGSPSKNPMPVDFIFAGYHMIVLYGRIYWPWMIMAFIVLASISWVWRQVYRMTGGLLIPVLSHMAADFGILMAVYWAHG